MPQPPTRSRVRLVASAGLMASAAAMVAITGAGPVPSLFQLSGASHDPSSVSSTSEATTDVTGSSVDDTSADAAEVEVHRSDPALSETTDSTIDDDQGTEVDDDQGTEVDDDSTDTTEVDDHGDDSTSTTEVDDHGDDSSSTTEVGHHGSDSSSD